MNYITDSQLDNLTHKTAVAMSRAGIPIPDELLSALNDTLAAFLADHCGASVKRDVPSQDRIITIKFDATVEVTQTIKVFNKHSDELFIYEGLNNGMLVTTLNHDEEYCQSIINPVTNELIAEIISQEVEGQLVKFG